jgi:predicted deacylase
MKERFHALPSASALTQRRLRSLHFGAGEEGGKRAYIQAALHADEVPPMLVAQHLIPLLRQAEQDGRIQGEVTLVPAANPVGLSQEILGSGIGRFDAGTGINFNRGYRHLTAELLPRVQGRLGGDAQANGRLIRQECLALLAAQVPQGEVEALKHLLQTLATPADVVLDLHCDHQASMHLYTGTPLAEAVQPLADALGAQAYLVARDSGDFPFDETVSRVWWELAEQLGPDTPVPLACLAATVELRGEADVSHEWAQGDAKALMAFLVHTGVLKSDGVSHKGAAHNQTTASSCPPTPLEAVEPLVAPQGGILVFCRQLGDAVQAGELVAQVIDPASDAVAEVRASVAGRLFARVARRHVHRGMRLAKIAGRDPIRSGKLLSL